MSWKDRAVSVADSPASGGDWRSRAVPADQSSDGYWSDVGKNAAEGVKQWPSGALGLADTATKAASVTSPIEMGKSIFQTMRGTPVAQTSSAQDLEGTVEGAKGVAQGVAQTAKDVGSAAIMPGQMAMGTPAKDTIFGKSFRDRPLSTTANVASVAIPAWRLFRARTALAPALSTGEAMASESAQPASQGLEVKAPFHEGQPGALFSYNDNFGPEGAARSQYTLFGDPNHPLLKEAGNTTQSAEYFKNKGIPIVGREPRTVGKWEPLEKPESPGQQPAQTPQPAEPSSPTVPQSNGSLNFLQRFGSKGANSQAGISAETVQALTRSGQNPAEVGNMIGKRLVDEGVLGQSPSETFKNTQKMQNNYGGQVKQALDAIKEANRSSGEWADVEDSLHVNSNQALKPLLDKKVALANSPFSANRAMARPWTEAYTDLANQANGTDGMTSLDHVNGTMKEVGQMLGKLEKGTAPYKNVASLYGTLANMRDGMVSDIAGRLGNPSLASNLLKANQGYSFYSRIMPDINWQAAQESVGGPEMSLMGTLTTEAKPLLAKAAVKTGSIFSRR